MRVPGRIYATQQMMSQISRENTIQQVANVATLPGIVGYSYAMPDIHLGYGFPIGGVAAINPAGNGVISPGGVGYDINCGVRLIATSVDAGDLVNTPILLKIVEELFRLIPCGIGSSGAIRKLSNKELSRLMVQGAEWAVNRGYGNPGDLDFIEDRGRLGSADPDQVSERARQRGLDQAGTLGAGNHFLEIGMIDTIYDETAAAVFGLEKGCLTLMVHTGSRGLGYQVCKDFLDVMRIAVRKYGIDIPDRQLVCAPCSSEEGESYFGAMSCAANFAWGNRQIISHTATKVIRGILGIDCGFNLVYDVSHNIARYEDHEIKGRVQTLCVHRKGATRAFPGGHPEIPESYADIGQPVIIPGDMGRYSFLAVGLHKSLKKTFGSACHGAGRLMSRNQSKKRYKHRSLVDELAERKIVVKAKSKKTLSEEAPEAYKDVAEVIDVLVQEGVCSKVARIRPIGVLKG